MIVPLTQYMRPRGEPKPVTCALPDDVARKAEGMVLTCEVLMSGLVPIYGRFADEDEDTEYMLIAKNEEGPDRPDLVLARVIETVYRRRK